MKQTIKQSSIIKTAKQIVDLKLTKVPTLIDPIMPKTGTISLAGSSDLGKSYLLLQLGIAIIKGSSDFLGFKLDAKHKRVIYVSTEDDEFSLCPRLLNMTKDVLDKSLLDNLKIVLTTKNLVHLLDGLLTKAPSDLVIIDTFSDIYDGDMNQTNKVRSFLQKYKELANKHETLIIFNHHCGKKNDNRPPHKDNLLGSQGFESSMRLVVELRKDFSDNNKRHFCIVKGNYLEEKYKSSSFELNFNFENGFELTGNRTSYENLAKSDKAESSDLKNKVFELREKGLSISKITEELNKQGHKIGKSTVGNYSKMLLPSIQKDIEEELDGN